MTATIDRTATAAPTTLACTLPQATLKDALATVSRVVSDKRIIPVIGNVKLTVDGDTLELAGTDLESTYVVRVPILDGQDGCFTVPAKLLTEFVSTLPNQPVTLRLDKGVLKVECGRSKATMKGIAPDDFPALPNMGEPICTLERDTLRQALAFTVFASTSDASRPVLTGVHLADGDAFVAEASDGSRLARYAHGPTDVVDNWHREPWDVIVPASGIRELIRLCDQADQHEIPLWVLPDTKNPAHLAAQIGEGAEATIFAVRLLAGVFPDLKRAIPQSALTTISVSRQAFLSAVKQCTLFSASEQKGFRLVELTISGNGESGLLLLKGEEAQTGEGAAEVFATVDGEGGTVLLNGPYLTDVLNALDCDMVDVGLSGTMSPVTLHDPNVPAYVHCFAPMVRTKA